MPFEFKLPDIGEGLVEGEIVKWLVKAGESVKENQPIVEVMTDKATVEITSPKTGKIIELRAKEGETVKVHSTIVVIEEGSGLTSTPDIGGAGSCRDMGPASFAGAGASSTRPDSHIASPVAGVKQTSFGSSQSMQARTEGPMILPPIPGHRILVAPAIRRLAIVKGLDLNTLKGTGPYGRVTRKDIESFSAPKAVISVAGGSYQTRGGETEEIPLRGLRKRIAAQMLRAKQHIPHFTYVEEVDMTELVELRNQLKSESKAKGIALTYLPFIFKAIVPALKKYPQVNSSLDDDRGLLIQKKYYNFGISVATDDGLMVPVIKGVDKLDIWQIAVELARLSEAVRDKKAKSAELHDSTFTVTSIGSIGGILATPVINYPEAAIMGIFKIRETPVVREGKIVVRHMMYLATSFDHRLVDGDVAAHFTNEVVEQLQNPEQLIH